MHHRINIGARALVIITTTVVAVFLFLASAGQATGELTPTTEYRVHPGDTLWEIAREVGPDGADTRDVIEQIRRINRLEGSVLQVGQRLEVPVYGTGAP